MSKSVICGGGGRVTVEVTNGAVANLTVHANYVSGTVALTPVMIDELIGHLRIAKSVVAELRELQ